MEASQLSLDEVSRLFRQFEDRHRLELTPTVVLCQYCYAQLPLKDLAAHWFLDHSSSVTQVTLNGDDDRCSGHEWTTTLQVRISSGRKDIYHCMSISDIISHVGIYDMI